MKHHYHHHYHLEQKSAGNTNFDLGIREGVVMAVSVSDAMRALGQELKCSVWYDNNTIIIRVVVH